MSTCAFPQHYIANEAGMCMAYTCPANEDCAGMLDDEAPPEPQLDRIFAVMESRLNALERSLSELKRAVALWVESMEGGDRGPD